MENNECLKQTPQEPTKSKDLNELFSAMAKAQSEIKAASLDAENPYFKSSFSSLAEIMRVSRPALTKNGLSVIQQILPNEEGQNVLHTILAHSSGQWIETQMKIVPTKPDVQALGSLITYLRRYSYAAIVGVVSSEEDDDGEITLQEEHSKINNRFDSKEQTDETLTKEQLEELNYELDGHPNIAQQILEGMKIQSLSDIPRSKFIPAINRVRAIKQLRAGK
jgi:hypothetical protein